MGFGVVPEALALTGKRLQVEVDLQHTNAIYASSPT